MKKLFGIIIGVLLFVFGIYIGATTNVSEAYHEVAGYTIKVDLGPEAIDHICITRNEKDGFYYIGVTGINKDKYVFEFDEFDKIEFKTIE